MKTTRSYYKSSSFKMAVLFTVLLGLAAILLGYFLYNFGKQNFIRETEAAIDGEIDHILSITTYGDNANVADYIDQRTQSRKHPIYFYQDRDENILAGNIDSIPKQVEILKEGVISFVVKEQARELLFAAKIYTYGNGSKLLVARDITEIIKSYDRLKLYSVLIMIFMLMVVLISFLLSMFVVTRINKIANISKEIMNTGDLSRRIEIDSKWDDLSYLAMTLNGMLAKIEFLMKGIRDVSDNIAHDLRTPITRLRGQLESLKNKKLSEKRINELVSEADNILSIFNSLLRISNIEKGKRHKSFEKVDVNSILQDVIELYEPLADDKKITIQSNLEYMPDYLGDRDLLFQMFANIVDNAIKFSENKSEVVISSKVDKNKFSISIADKGIGVQQEEMQKIFDRFYRSDKSRNTQGSGLGLSMVKAVAEMHNLSIDLSDNNPGLQISVSFSKGKN